jgi:hypothetical protein
VPPNQGAGARNIAQPYVTCQEKLLFALDKHFLTKRERLASVTSCNAKCANESVRARCSQILKPRIQIAVQMVTQHAQSVCATSNERTQSISDSKFIAVSGRA